MKTLVTGGSGFIGRELLKSDKLGQFRAILRKDSPLSYEDSFAIEAIDSNTNWSGAFSGIDNIIHLAGSAHNTKPVNLVKFEVNIDGTLHLATEAAKAGVKRFIFVSSIAVYGSSSSGPFTEKSLAQPNSEFGKSKIRIELGLKSIAASYGMELVIVRPPLVYGAKAPANFQSLVKLVSLVPLLPFGLVNNLRSFVSVGNLVDFLCLCTRHPKAAGNVFLISDCSDISIKQFTNAIADGLEKQVFQLPVPTSLISFIALVLGKKVQINQLMDDLQIDCSKAKLLLEWKPPETLKQSMTNIGQ